MTLSELYKMNYDILDLTAMNQYYWQDGQSFTMNRPRPTNAFLYMSDARVVCVAVDGETIEAPCGSILYIPAGTQYTHTFYKESSPTPQTKLFEFNIKLDGEIKLPQKDFSVLPKERSAVAATLLSKLIAEMSKPLVIPALVKILSYELLNSVLREYSCIELFESEYRAISKGIEYMNSDIKQEKSIEEIAQMCFVSVNYFERLFKKYSGMTPVKYRLHQKIERSKSLLESRQLTIEQIAAELNFYDSSHFCRSFSAVTGMTPKNFLKQ